MPVAITRYSVLLSSPTDAAEECEVAEDVIQAINRTHSETTGIELYLKDWKRDSRADSGDEPQALLNRQIVESSDIILSIFKNRFGSPTKSYGSGTEEEIALGLEMDKHVLVYFWIPSDLSQITDKEEYARISEFRSRIASSGIYKTFENSDELSKLVMHDFTSLIFDLERGGAIAKAPSLELQLVNRKHIGERIRQIKFDEPFLHQLLNYEALDDCIAEDARILIEKANERAEKAKEERKLQELWKSQANNNENASGSLEIKRPNTPVMSKIAETASAMTASKIDASKLMGSVAATDIFQAKPVVIDSEDGNLIEATLQELGVEYFEGILDLGSLKRDSVSMLGYQAELRGTDEELERYEIMKRLLKRVKMRKHVKSFLEDNADVFGVGLCIKNNGGSPALHAKVELKLPVGFVASADMIVMPSDYLADEMLSSNREWFDSLFEMTGDADIDDYYDANPGFSMPHLDNKPYFPSLGLTRLPFDANDCRDDLDSLLVNFDISISTNDDGYLLKLDFNRVQHGTSYAFPCFLLFKGELPESLDYRIRCDQTPKAAEGSVMTTKPSE